MEWLEDIKKTFLTDGPVIGVDIDIRSVSGGGYSRRKFK